MFVRMAISKVMYGNEEEFHNIQSEMHKILQLYGVEILGYYFCPKTNTVFCPANWGSKERLMQIARELQKDEQFMKLHERTNEIVETTELHEVINYTYES